MSTKEQGRCDVCCNFEIDVDAKVTPAQFIVAAKQCSRCSAILRALQSVTDISRPDFTKLEIERGGGYLHKGVLQVRCIQEGVPVPGKLHNALENPFPNRYSFYTPEAAGLQSAIPGLGLRDGDAGDYREHADNVADRIQLAKSWLDECIAKHGDCGLSSRSWPRRVLDLNSDPIRLCPAPSSSDVRYAALSYCWGKSGNVTTVKSNLNSHIAGIALTSLPRTMREAIYVCLELGIRYIWIDALCIIQDDTDDWMDQIPMMSSIYTGAHIVLAAQAASSVHGGLLNFGMGCNAPMKRLEFDHIFNGELRRVKLSVQEENQEYHLIPGHHSSRPVGDDAEIDALSTRAWAFQERFLARRVLFFSRSEISWKCSKYKRCECTPTERPLVTEIFDDYWATSQLSEVLNAAVQVPPSPLKLLSIWGEVVRQFSQLTLSNCTDRLAAVQGVVVALAEAFPDSFSSEDYVFGMWRREIARLLTWYRFPVDEEAASNLQSAVPSWSWAHTPSPVDYYPFAWSSEAIPLIDVLSVDCEMSNRVMLGGGQGTITASGLLIPTQGEIDERFIEFDDPPQFPLPDTFKSPDEWAMDPVLKMDVDNPADELSWHAVTHFLPLIREAGDSPKTQGIFLVPVEGRQGAFRRVGYYYDYGCSIYLEREEIETYRETFQLV